MKKFLTHIFQKFSSPRFASQMFVVVMTILITLPSVIHADQTAVNNCLAQGGVTTLCNALLTAAPATPVGSTTQTPTTLDDSTAVVTATNPPTNNNTGGSWITNLSLSVITEIISVPLQVVMTLIAALLGLTGLLLDYVIKLSVTNLASNISTITGINTAWTLIRDLCNMSFIFILVYYAIMMVFGKRDAKKIIVPIIIAAILINFSLFFTKVIIDASNVVTVSFYNSISQSAGGSSVPGQSYTLSGAFMKDLNLTSIYSANTISATTVPGTNPGPYVATIVGSSLFMLIAAFIFLAMAVLFIIRYLTFILLLIISPFGYVASAIPGTKGLSDKYWDTLLGQALFAPIFMIMIWITLTLASSFTSVTGTTAASMGAAFATPSATTIGTLVNFALLAGLLIYAIIISKSYATKGGIVSGKMVNQATGFAGGALFGSAAFVGRGTLGAAANSRANNEDLKKRAAEGSKWAQLQLKTSKYVAGSTFDARRSDAAEKIQKVGGIDFGKGTIFNDKAGKDGYTGRVKERVETEEKYAKSLKPSDGYTEAKKAERDTQFRDEEFKQREEREKIKYFSSDAWREKYEKDFGSKIRDEKAKTQMAREMINPNGEGARTMANQERDLATANLQLADLIRRRDMSRTQDERLRAEADIVAKTEDRNKIEAGLVLFKQDFDEATKTAGDEKKRTDKIETEAKAYRDTWMSDLKKAIISQAGGQEEKKTKGGIVTQQSVDSEANLRNTTYAQKLEKKGSGLWTVTRVVRGNPQMNKAAAAKVRSLNKSKSNKDKVFDALKEEAKNDTEAETPVPETPATPPPAGGPPPTP